MLRKHILYRMKVIWWWLHRPVTFNHVSTQGYWEAYRRWCADEPERPE